MHVYEKARKAMFKMFKYKHHLGQITPKLGLKLYDSLIKPIYDYCSEITMIDTNIEAIEKLHLSFLKGLLKVRKQKPTLAVYAELGRHPVAVDFENKSLKFWLRVSNRKDRDWASK